MKLKQEQIRRLAEKVFQDLTAEALLISKTERTGVVEGIARAIAADFEREQVLERDAERLLDEAVRAMGRGAAEIDRRTMLRMIKEKLARERKIVL